MKILNLFKLLILGSGIVVFTAGCASMMGVQVPEEDKRFETIIDVPNLSKNELYVKANSWFVENFKSAESVIEFQDKEDGKIMGKYVFSYSGLLLFTVTTTYVRQVISIDIKDGKVRFVIKDPYKKVDNGGWYPLKNPDDFAWAKEEWKNLSSSLEKYLKTDNNSW